MWSSATKNGFLDSLTTFYVSAHDDYPGDTGANEISGGTPTYARLAITYAAASGGVRSATSSPVLDIPVGDAAWVGLWDAATSGNYLGCQPNGGARKRFFASATTNLFTVPGHGILTGDRVVVFGAGTAPGGLTKGTEYYAVSVLTDTFALSETLGGDPVDLQTAGSGELFVSKIVRLTYAVQGTLTINAAAMDLNT